VRYVLNIEAKIALGDHRVRDASGADNLDLAGYLPTGSTQREEFAYEAERAALGENLEGTPGLVDGMARHRNQAQKQAQYDRAAEYENAAAPQDADEVGKAKFAFVV
jgi:hypothetical protein